MARERLNAIDVAISVSNLKKILNNITLVNIYDITNRVFILKFSRNENKIFVLIEIGCRIHATQFLRSVDHLPSNFNAKLRKHLRNRRLRDVSQMCQDRVIDFTFSTEEHTQHLIIQLFLPGNIYLTDHEYKVLTVLKPKNTGDNYFKVGSNYVYNMEYNSWFEPVKKTQVEELLISNKLTDLVRAIFPSIHNAFILSALKLNGNAVEDVKTLDRLYSMEEIDLVCQYVESVRQCLVGLLTRKDKVPGYIYRNSKGDMDDFGPFELPNSEYHEDYNFAIDAFFTKNELVKQEKKTVSKKPTKLNKIKADQDKRESKLMDEIVEYSKQIKVLEENIDIVDNCLNLTKALIASGASWNDIYEQLQLQRKQNHPLACYMRDINIPNQTLTFVNNPQANQSDFEGDGANDDQFVVLDYRLTGYQNLKKFYINRKKTENKLERTKIGKQFALKKVAKSLSKQPETKNQDKRSRDVKISSLRKRFWFEKFYWFITSQGYLVLAGRDSLQNELLVKKYLTKGDLYFHADIHGASSVILKTNSSEMFTGTGDFDENHPDRANEDEFIANIKVSIEEAASFAVCHSNAWNDKFSVQSWWVYWHQVSKTPPTGEYVPQGSFVIRGKKNYLQPQKLEMGITYLFQIQPLQTLDDQLGNDDVKVEPENQDDNLTNGTDESLNLDADVDAGPDTLEDNSSHHEDGEYSDETQGISSDEEESLSEEASDDPSESDDQELDEELDDSLDVVDDDISTDQEDDIEYDERFAVKNDEEEDDDQESTINYEEDENYDDEAVSDEDEVEEESNVDDKTVRMGNVETIGVREANIVKRTRGRLATVYPIMSQLNNIKEKLEMLNLTKNSDGSADDDDEEQSEGDGRTVKIVMPERVSHTEEAVRKIRQRKATCVNLNLSDLRKLIESTTKETDSVEKDTYDSKRSSSIDTNSISSNNKEVKLQTELSLKKSSNRAMRLMNQKVNKIKKKYAQDDEETQELRRMLTGSKKLKPKSVAKTTFQTASLSIEKMRENKFKNKEILTINDKELENYMNQLSCLTKELKEDDDVLNVIPMCAPYSAIKSYKNSLKLVPGNSKKGTIATQSLQYFMKNDPLNAHYLKLITTDQLTLTLIGNCKFTNSKM